MNLRQTWEVGFLARENTLMKLIHVLQDLRNRRIQNDRTSRKSKMRGRRRQLTTYRPVGYAASKKEFALNKLSCSAFQLFCMCLATRIHINRQSTIVFTSCMQKSRSGGQEKKKKRPGNGHSTPSSFAPSQLTVPLKNP